MQCSIFSAFELELEPTSSQSVVERPPPGLARGAQPAPAGLIAVIALAALLITLVYFASRFRNRSK